MNKLFYNGVDYIEVPSGWHECERWQLAALVRHMHDKQDLFAHRLMAFFILASTKDHFKHQLIIAGLDEEDRHDVAKHLTWWLYEKPIYFRHNPFPKYKGYHGPGADFQYVYFEEFIKAEKYYTAFAQDHQPEDLDGLVASLYRPKRWFYDEKNPLNPEDPRVLFSNSLHSVMLEKVKDWPEDLKLSIFYYFDSCLQLLVKLFPWAFTPAGESGPKLANDSKKTLYHVARELAKGIQLEQVLMRPVVPIFFELNESRIDAEKLKIQIKQQNRGK